MNWINRFIVRIGSAGAAALLASMQAVPALGDAPIDAFYQGQNIRFTHVSSFSGATAIGVDDPGFQSLLRASGAVLTWKPGERYVMITTSAPAVVTFALGDRRYDIGPIALEAAFAPYQRGEEAYLPLEETLRALDLALLADAQGAVLQPQLAGLDTLPDGNRMMLYAHGALSLHPRIVRESDSSITYAFDGVGTTLSGTRQVNAGGVRSVQVSVAGSAREPVTLVAVQLQAGAVAEAPREEEHDVVLTFDGAAGAQAPAAQAPAESQEAAPNATANGQAVVTAVSVQPMAGGVTVSIAVSGNSAYEWHRLRQPDNRFWIDFGNAQLQGPPLDENAPAPLVSVRVRQDDPSTVRVALSLQGQNSISIVPSATGLSIEIGTQEVADAARSGSGTVGSVISASEQNTAPVTPAPLGYDQSNWKFGPRTGYVPTNPRLIVIDPGHGGSDRGTIHGGVAEADLTLDMAKRLRDILVARGWEVKLTREADVDVYQPNDSARDELQARDDIANNAGARILVSIHVNAFINSGPYGTTYYVSKPEDLALARAMESKLESDGTKDDGIVQSHLYVTLHARMPAVLIETAFLSNPGDYALLTAAEWRQKIAQEMADGIGQYTQDYPVSNQPAQ